MLERLDTIDWHALAHAYGPADDVPGLLRALAFGDTEASDDAVSTLFSNIWHQGTVYEATAYAVPFLVEIVQSPASPARVMTLNLLAAIARGKSFHAVHQHYWPFAEARDTPEFAEALQREQAWVDAARSAVCASVSVFLDLLTDLDWQVRAVAAYLLGRCQERAQEILPVMRARLQRKADVRVRASLVLHYGALVELTEGNLAFLRHYLGSEHDPLIRLLAAMALTKLARAETPPDAVAALIDTIAHPEHVEGMYQELPWDRDTALGDVVHLLSTYFVPVLPQDGSGSV